WETTTGTEIGKNKAENLRGEALAFSPDGKTLAVGKCHGDKILLLDGTTLKETGSLQSDVHIIKGLAFSPDGRFLAGAGGEQDVVGGIGHALAGKRVLLWDLKRDKKPQQLTAARVTAHFAFTPDSKVLACASRWGSEIFLWDT